MWIRYESPALNKGIFQIRSEVQHTLSSEDHDRLAELVAWFNSELNAAPWDIHGEQVRFWFRDDAERFLHTADNIATLYRRNGIKIRVRKCKRPPGAMVWQDDVQAAFRMRKRCPKKKTCPKKLDITASPRSLQISEKSVDITQCKE